jgi:D-lactate dehydrogenase
MHVTFFSTRPYDAEYFSAANRDERHVFRFLDVRLSRDTAPLAGDARAVCAFVNDTLDAEVLDVLARGGTRLIAMRCAGYNNVDLATAAALGLPVVRVPAYSPHAVAEHAFALILALNRHIPRAFARVRDGNFSLDNLVGFDLFGKTVGVVGTGAIGLDMVRIARGFGCRVLAVDPVASPDVLEAGGEYVSLPELLAGSHIVSLHCPLLPSTFHLVDAAALASMRAGSMLINTSRGALVDTQAAIAALKSGQLGSLGIDVYEEESNLFFVDRSSGGIADDVFARLLTFPNVLVTGHQAFLTHEALTAIAATTVASLDAFEHGRPLACAVAAPPG